MGIAVIDIKSNIDEKYTPHFMQSQTAFFKSGRVWHRAVSDGKGGRAPLCNMPMVQAVTLKHVPPVGRLCGKCARIAADRRLILIYLTAIRRREHKSCLSN